MSRIVKVLVGVVGGSGGLLVALWTWGIRVPAVEAPETHGTLHRDHIEAGGRQRTFTYYVPSAGRPNRSLMVVLHGSSMDGAQMRRATGYDFETLADREGLIVVYPDGFRGNWNDCRAVGRYPARSLGVDDIAFLRALIAWFERTHEVSADRVFAMGFSNGGQMAYRLALEAPELVRAIAAVAANLPTPENTVCAPTGRPVPTMIVNGTQDPLNPHRGGSVSLHGVLFRRGRVESSEGTAHYWVTLAGERALHRAHDRLADSDPSDRTVTERRIWSRDGTPHVLLLEVEGGGHAIPHPGLRFPRVFGRTGHDFSTAELAWRFFAAQFSDSDPRAMPSAVRESPTADGGR